MYKQHFLGGWTCSPETSARRQQKYETKHSPVILGCESYCIYRVSNKSQIYRRAILHFNVNVNVYWTHFFGFHTGLYAHRVALRCALDASSAKEPLRKCFPILMLAAVSFAVVTELIFLLVEIIAQDSAPPFACCRSSVEPCHYSRVR